jgi:predicted transcriptional regulator
MDIKKNLEIIVLDLLHLMTTFKLKYLALLAISDSVMAIILDNHQVTSEFRQNKGIVSVKSSVKN